MKKSSEKQGRPGYKAALAVIEMLEKAGFKAMMAGGCVRDRLLGIEPKDYDVATNAKPDQVCSILEQKRVKVIPTGIEHGTVTAVIKRIPIEITTLRRDLETDGRHAVVAFDTSDFREDAARRDFTINAMFESVDGEIVDFFGGQEDLTAKRLRFVGDPTVRIKEDYLRIMRFFRFWARFDMQAAPEALSAIYSLKSGLSQISQERITFELMEMLASDSVQKPMKGLVQSGVFQIILPELGSAGWGRIDLGTEQTFN